MTYYQPSQENIDKVIAYFVSKVKATGSRRFSETVNNIADNSYVALATAHRVINQLEIEKRSQLFAIIAGVFLQNTFIMAISRDFFWRKTKMNRSLTFKNWFNS